MKIQISAVSGSFKKSGQYGLFLLFILTSWVDGVSQNDDQYFITVDSVMEKYYYTDSDSAIQVLSRLYTNYTDQRRMKAALYVLLNKTYVAEHHYLIDSLDIYLQWADSLLVHPIASDFSPDFTYMRGMYNYYSGDYDLAIENFKSLLYEKGMMVIRDSMQTYNALCNLGQLSVYHQNYGGADQYYQLAKKVLPVNAESYASVRDRRYEQSFLKMAMTKAQFYRVKNLNEKDLIIPVIQSFREAIDLIRDKEGKAGANNLFITLYTHLSQAYLQADELDNAEKSIKTAIALSHGGDPERRVNLYFEASNLQVQKQQYALAEHYLRKADDLIASDLRGKNRFQAKRCYEAGNIARGQKEYEKALAEYQKGLSHLVYNKDMGLAIYEVISLDSAVAESEILKGILYKAETLVEWYKASPLNIKTISAAIASYEQAFHLINKIRTGFQNDESKLFLSSIMAAAFEKGMDACYIAYQHSPNPVFINKAFQFSEQNKNVQLLEIVKDLSSKSFSRIPESLIEEERRLNGRIFYWREVALKSENSKDNAYQKLLESQHDHEDFVKKLEVDYPGYYRLKYSSESLVLNQVQKSMLDAHTVVVEYFYGRNHLYMLGMAKDSLILYRTPFNENLRESILTFLSEVKDPNSDSFEDNAIFLYHKLLQPLEEILPPENGKLFIIPDDLLGYVPFEALKSGNSIKNRYLIQDYTIMYDYSLTLHREKIKRRKEEVKYAYVGFAPEYKVSDNRSTVQSTGKLRFNRDEVMNAGNLMEGRSFTKGQATERNFYDYAENTRVLHLSMHAVVDDINPTHSAFYFEPTNETDSINANMVFEADGSLHVYEIYNLSLKADLAVLSACETGNGELARGEGIISLGRAFQFAGCPSVVMSLWQINDKSTAEIIHSFFENLQKGMYKDQALRQAKLDFINNPENKFFAHPYYWSAFVFMGNSQPLESTIWVGWYIILLVVFFILLVGWSYKKGAGARLN